jgi:TolB-like protein
MRYSGSDSSLMPLERGLADLLVTDLSRSAALTVVERDRMQAIVDEMKLSQTTGVDSSTSVRSGRILRAGRVVQGGITELPGRSVSVTAAIIDVPTAQALKSVQNDDRLEQLFTIEKKIAYNLFDALDVHLTVQERALVEQRPTRSLAAFLAYSAGLMAEDNGNLGEAARFFGEAARIDPSFAAAAQRRDNVEAAQSGQAITTATLEATLNGGFEGSVVNAANRGIAIDNFSSLSGTINSVINDLNPSIATQADAGSPITPPSERDPFSSTTHTDSPFSNLGRISIVVKQPGTP